MRLYCIEAVGCKAIKVGKSMRPSQRLRTMQTSHFADLRIIRIGMCGPQTERNVHKAIEKFRIRGEWFSIEALSMLDRNVQWETKANNGLNCFQLVAEEIVQ